MAPGSLFKTDLSKEVCLYTSANLLKIICLSQGGKGLTASFVNKLNVITMCADFQQVS